MPQRFFVLLSLLLIGTLPIGSSAAAAGRARVLLAATATLTLDQATARVRRESGGRILSAGRVQRKGRPMYRFKVLTPQGRVRTLWVDPGGEPGDARGRGRKR